MTESVSVPTAEPLSWATEHWAWLAAGGALLAALFLAVVVLAWLLLRRKRPPPPADESIDERAIDVSELDAHPPDALGPQLEVYGTPVRVAVVVMAPPGRGGSVPLKKELPALAEYLLPNLGQVLIAQQPLYARWPLQLSTQGFVQSFYNKVSLPGDHGKGTPWCSLAGKFEAHGQVYLIGLLCCAAAPNGLGEIAVEHPGQWLQILRVRGTP